MKSLIIKSGLSINIPGKGQFEGMTTYVIESRRLHDEFVEARNVPYREACSLCRDEIGSEPMVVKVRRTSVNCYVLLLDQMLALGFEPSELSPSLLVRHHSLLFKVCVCSEGYDRNKPRATHTTPRVKKLPAPVRFSLPTSLLQPYNKDSQSKETEK